MTNRILIYNSKWEGSNELGKWTVFYVKPNTRKDFDKFDIIVIIGGSFDTFDSVNQRSEVMRLERKILTSLEKGSIVCMIMRFDLLILQLLKTGSFQFSVKQEPIVDLVIKRAEFSTLLKKFGGTTIHFAKPTECDYDDIICTTKSGFVAGFTKKVGRGALLFLPRYTTYEELKDYDFVGEYLTDLLDSLESYRQRIMYSPPSWVRSYSFHEEQPVISDINKFQEEIKKREKVLGKYSKLKEILWLRDNELVDSVMNFLNQMEVGTKKDEIYEEDFWIVENNVETVICEVKGLDKNLKRPHISQLDEHRGAREKSDDFPALLVVNSFNRADSLKGKDISTNEIKKAVRTNVLTLRTLDLCNLYSLIEKNREIQSNLLNLFKTETGWLKVTASGYKIKKE